MKIELNLNRVFTFLLLCTLMFSSSCKKDKDTDDRDNFVGTYETVETCPGGTDEYNLIISAGSEDNEILISNIYDAGGSGTKATVDGDNFTIADQPFVEGYGNALSIEGSGSISESTINLNITLQYEDGYNETCTAVCTKK